MLLRSASSSLFFFFFLLLLLSRPALGQEAASNPTECFGSDAVLDPETDYFPHKVQPEASQFWTIEYRNTYKVVRNLESMSNFVLYPCGTAPPSPTNFLFENVTAFVPVPLRSVGVMMTPTITFLEQIDELDTVEYFLTETQYISSPCFLDRIEAGLVAVPIPPDLTVDPTTGASVASGPPNVTLNGTVAFGSSYDAATFFQTIVPFSEFAETTNQGIFEWVKFLAAFYNKEELANQVFDATQEQWDCVSREASSVAADMTPPKVLWAYYSDFCGGWDVGSCPNYYCEYAAACGAEMLDFSSVNGTAYSEDCGVAFLTVDEVAGLGKDADIFFYLAPDWNATYAQFQEELDLFKSVQAKQVFDYQGSGANAWFQERFAEYYDVLDDYCRAVGTGRATPQTERWFRNVFTGPVGDQGECDPDAAPTLPFVFEGCEADDGGGNSNSSNNNNTNSSTDGGSSSAPEGYGPRRPLLWVAAALAVVAVLT